MPRRGRGSRSTQAVRTTSGRTQGDVIAQERAQRAAPLPQTRQPTRQVSPPTAGQLPPGAVPPDIEAITPFAAGSQRPEEPVTAGLPSGPGPGPEALGSFAGLFAESDKELATLQAIFQVAPTPGLRAVIERLQADFG